MSENGQRRRRFGDFELDSQASKLLRAGQGIKIQPQPLRVLQRKSASRKSAGPRVNRNTSSKNGEEKRRLGVGSTADVGGGGENNVNWREAVARELASPALVKGRVPLEVGDDEQVNVTAAMHRALGVRAEEHDAFGSESSNQALQRALDQRWQFGLRFSLQHNSPIEERRRSDSWSAIGSPPRPVAGA